MEYMFKPLFTSLCIFSLSSASLFTITDQQGNIVQSKEIQHTENAYLNQKHYGHT